MTEYGLTFPRIVRFEWAKLWSLRSSWIVLCGVPVVLVGLSAIIGLNNRGLPEPPPVSEAIGGGFLAFALAIGVFGVLTITGEYNSGLIRTTLVAVPRRLPVLWAKAVVLVAVTAPTMLVAQFGSFLANQLIVGSSAGAALGDPDVLRAIVGVAGATVAAGLFGLGIGTMVRSTAAAVMTFVVGLILVPQVLLGVLPASVQDTVLPYLPTLALQSLFDVSGSTPVLDVGAGLAVVAGWAILLLAGGALLLWRRDA
jgi:ABC-2 type transport system permease protein